MIKRGEGLRIAAAILAVSFAVCAGAPARAQASLEYPVKAAYLYKFGPFVEWPAAAFGSGEPVTLCIVGADPFGPLLERTVEGQRIGQRSIVVRRMERIDRGSGCHIAYLSGSRAQTVAESLASVQGASVLTVTDAGRSGAARGIIHFVIKDNRVRFHIDEQAAAHNGITISSKLLSLALSVRLKKGRG